MNKELTLKLNEDYPELFLFMNFRNLDYFVVECGDGWYDIIDSLLSNITHYVKTNNNKIDMIDNARHQIENGERDQVTTWLQEMVDNDGGPSYMDYPEVQQIKEKFGTLRIYLHNTDDFIDGMVVLAELISNSGCGICGNKGQLRSGQWSSTLCDHHDEIRIKALEDK